MDPKKRKLNTKHTNMSKISYGFTWGAPKDMRWVVLGFETRILGNSGRDLGMEQKCGWHHCSGPFAAAVVDLAVSCDRSDQILFRKIRYKLLLSNFVEACEFSVVLLELFSLLLTANT